MTEVHVLLHWGGMPRPLRMPPHPERVFTCQETWWFGATAHVPKERYEEVRNLPTEERVAVVKGKPFKWVCVSHVPFFLFYPESGEAEISIPLPCSRVAEELDVEGILELKGKLPRKTYLELLAAKLRET
jgi:hypothetical protein